ncbi:hypothetical protein NST37_09355 [Brevibacillus sp. FSL K6-6036]|uniref:hypothetical protein n=1 Tax=Brevibacillus sp. FSL K6-6036 TaxID=2954682 RepID=UPI0030CFC70C
MERDQWLKGLKERADRSVLHDVVFSPEMEENIRRTIKQEAGRKKRTFSPGRWGLWASAAAAVLLLALVGTAITGVGPGEHARQPVQEKPWLPATIVNPPDLWKPSPRSDIHSENQVFSYLGEKPVRIMTDEFGLYEDQAQRISFLLNGSFGKEVELVAYSTEGKRIKLGSYEVLGPEYDADGHFSSSIALPDPGVWKLQVLSGSEHFGQVFVQVEKGVSPENREFVTPLITAYLQTAQGNLSWLGADRDVHIELIGVETQAPEKRRVYAWVRIEGKAEEGSPGLSCPMVLDIAYEQKNGKGGAYRVISHSMPEDGSRYQPSLKKLFPEKYLQRLSEGKKP